MLGELSKSDVEERGVRLRRVAFVFALFLGTGLALSPGPRASLKAMLLVPHFFPGEVPRPLQLTAAPEVATTRIRGAPGEMVADVYRPLGGPHPAMIILLGVEPLPRNHPQVTTLADGIARTGIVVAVAESAALVAGEIRPEEVDNLVALFQYLEGDPRVDPKRIGFVGLCVGAVLEVLAAADDRIADRVAYVNAFSVYADPLEVLRALLSETMPTPGGPVRWSPHPTTRSVFFRHVIGGVPDPTDRSLLTREFLEGTPLTSDQAAALSPLGARVRQLLTSRQPEEIETNLATLPDDFLARFRLLSPSSVAHRIKASTFVMHDENDTLLPVSGARQLAAALPSSALVRYTEFRLFAHVVPESGENPLAFGKELLNLVGHVSAVLRAVETGKTS